MKSRGFTLIELVIVIIVLGVLAATAVPEFLNLKDDAEKATLRGASGTFKSGVDIISAKHKLDGSPTSLKFTSQQSKAGYYNINFIAPLTNEIVDYPTSTTALFCEGIWNVAVEGIIADSVIGSDANVIVTHEFKTDFSRMRCDYKYKDIGSIYYMSGEGDICVQYEGDNIPDTCNI